MIGLHVEVRQTYIVVTLPGSNYMATYRKRGAYQPLAPSSYSGREGHGAPVTRAEFRARSWKLANAKAKELGWIV